MTTTQIPFTEVKVGDIIRDDIACLVTGVLPLYYAGDDTPIEVTVFVLDGNGYTYMIRRDSGSFEKFNWTAEEWETYRNA